MIRTYLTLIVLLGSTLAMGQNSNKNYIQATVAKKPLTGAINNLKKHEVDVTITYLDGLGRVQQVVNKEASPNGKDLISVRGYDDFGRQDKNYLPYEWDSNGAFRPNWQTEINTFYTSAGNGVVNESSNYYSKTKFEASPLNRVEKFLAPGAAWLGSDRGVASTHEANYLLDNIYSLKVTDDGVVSLTSGGYYQTGELFKTTTTDENGNKVVAYKDKEGQLICNRAYLDATNFAATLYLYDDFGLLRYVLQPEGVKEMGSNFGLLNDTSFQDKWMFSYQYDYRKRLIEKKVPGAAVVYMVYDNRDRLVLIQDGNLREKEVPNSHQSNDDDAMNRMGTTTEVSTTSTSAESNQNTESVDGRSSSGEVAVNETFTSVNDNTRQAVFYRSTWLFTKYDAMNRPVLTGEVVLTGDRAMLQSQMNGMTDYDIAYIGNTPNNIYGYDNTSYPVVSANSIYTVNYYDKYNFVTDLNWGSVYEIGNFNTNTKGVITGSQIRQLGKSMLKSVTYYDEVIRPLVTINENHLDGTDKVSRTYFNLVSPNIKRTTQVHTAYPFTDNLSTPVAKTIFNEFNYDHFDRLVSSTLTIDGNRSEVKQVHNAIGQLIAKDLGGAQQVDYTYNIRGWLTKINSGTLAGTDKFGMLLKYNNAVGYEQFNGNIGQITWRTLGGSEDGIQTYSYTYDGLNRLKTAKYENPEPVFNSGSSTERLASGSTTPPNLNGEYGVNLTYDLNGNILGLTRNMEINSAIREIDVLNYSYTEGNKLTSVAETGINSGDSQIRELGFKDGNTTGDDYNYDINGNMIEDRNKDITSIRYNHLNLPVRVDFLNGDHLEFHYDASGEKLHKKTVIGTNSTWTHYAGGIQYTNTTLDFLQHEEGRYQFSNARFQYDLKDHLGNIRATVERVNPAAYTNIHYSMNPSEIPKFPTQTLVNFSSTQKYAGDYSLLVSGPANTSASPVVVPVDPGQKININVQAYSLYGTARVKIDFYDNNGDFDQTLIEVVENLPPGGVWTHLESGELIAPADGSIKITLSKGNYADVYFDELDISVQAGFLSENDINVVQVDNYYPFGGTFNSYTSGTKNNFLYNGKELQNEIGWYDYGARNYDPTIARFIQVDPMAEILQEAWTPYHYVKNNPIKYIDPTGMIWKDQKEADELKNKVQDRIKNLGNQKSKLQAKLGEEGISDKKKARLENRINDIDSRTESLNGTVAAIDEIGAHEKTFDLVSNSGETNHVKEGSDGVINIQGGNDALQVHEIEHVSLSINSEKGLEFTSGGYLKPTTSNGLKDEVAGYRAQYGYNPSSLPDSPGSSRGIDLGYIANLKKSDGTPVYPALHQKWQNQQKQNRINKKLQKKWQNDGN